jgi:PTH1 family peptidyl-tRNA hydrolase
VDEAWKLLLGLGNPGEKYRSTRHNAGFMALATLAQAKGLGDPSTFKSSLVLKGRLGQARVILAWPQTYMNLSGLAARELVNFYKIDSSAILVLHDDMDLEVGRLKATMGGGSAGHNGLISLMDELDGDFARLRIGIGRPDRSLFGGDWSPYVLSPFVTDELEPFDRSLELAAEAAAAWVASGLAAAQRKVNRKPKKAAKPAQEEGGEPEEGSEPGPASG